MRVAVTTACVLFLMVPAISLAHEDDFWSEDREGREAMTERLDDATGRWKPRGSYEPLEHPLPEPRARLRRGRLLSQPCPYDCSSAGIAKSSCRDWREGDICFIEDLR